MRASLHRNDAAVRMCTFGNHPVASSKKYAILNKRSGALLKSSLPRLTHNINFNEKVKYFLILATGSENICKMLGYENILGDTASQGRKIILTLEDGPQLAL